MSGSSKPYPGPCNSRDWKDSPHYAGRWAVICPRAQVEANVVCSNFSVKSCFPGGSVETSNILLPVISTYLRFSRNNRTSALSKIKPELFACTVSIKEISQSQWYELNILFPCFILPTKWKIITLIIQKCAWFSFGNYGETL